MVSYPSRPLMQQSLPPPSPPTCSRLRSWHTTLWSFLFENLYYRRIPSLCVNMDGQSQIDISKLNAADRKELNQFLTNEAQKSNIQQSKYQYITGIPISPLDYPPQTGIVFDPSHSHSPHGVRLFSGDPWLTFLIAVHHLADVCWKKCVTGKISSGRLDRAEETCAQNCVERWMDANLAVLKHLETLRGQWSLCTTHLFEKEDFSYYPVWRSLSDGRKGTISVEPFFFSPGITNMDSWKLHL